MPLLRISVAFILGILVGGIAKLPSYIWLGTASVGIVLILTELLYLNRRAGWRKIRAWLIVSPGILLIFLAFGGFRHLAGQIVPQNALAHYNDRGTYTLIGRVSAPPDQREDAVYIDLSVIEIEDPLTVDPSLATRQVKGNVRVRFPAGADYRIGDVLRFTGKPLTPSTDEHFSYKDYLARQRIATVMYYPRQVHVVDHGSNRGFRGWLEDRRQDARRLIFSLYPQPESGLLSGILLGLDRDIPRSLTRSYQQTGTAHIIAISGFNMGILALVFNRIFSRFLNRYWAALFSGLAILVYTIFVGSAPSVVRAALMAVSAFGGHLIGRRQAGLNALGFTAACMCLVNPLLLWDVSFQLSFAATLGLVLFAEPLHNWLDARFPDEHTKRITTPVYQYFLLTLAAQLMTLPLIAFHFGRVSLSSFVANPLILPIQPPLLILGGVSVILGAFLPFLGKLVSVVAWPMAVYSNFIAAQLSTWDYGSLPVNEKSALWILAFLILFILLFVFRSFLTKLFKGRYYWLFFFLLLGAISTWSMVSRQPDGRLHIHLLSAGEEPALFMVTPSGKTLLFDPGKEVNEISAAVGAELSPWSYRVDAVWLGKRTGARTLSELNERVPLRAVVLAPVVYRAAADTKPLDLPAGIDPVKLQPGSVMDYSAGVTVRVLAESYDSAAFLVTHGSLKILIPNGVDFALIKAADPAALKGLSVLILNESDISYIPPRVWQQLAPRQVLWNSPSVTPVNTWLGPAEAGRVHLVSDGTNLFEPSRP